MVIIMNRLNTAQRVAVVKALVEGNSIRSTVRLTGVAKNTVTKLLVELPHPERAEIVPIRAVKSRV